MSRRTPPQSVQNRPGPGFTLVEILAVLFIAGLVSLPFTKMFTFGRQGSIDNLEHIVAYNLAREKMEEVKSLPFDMVKSDFENFRDIYRDLPDLAELFASRDRFSQEFSDIFTTAMTGRDENREIWERFQELYKKTFLREYLVYPDEMGAYRRILDVDERIDNSHPPRLKKVTIKVFDRQGHRMAELNTLIGRHK